MDGKEVLMKLNERILELEKSDTIVDLLKAETLKEFANSLGMKNQDLNPAANWPTLQKLVEENKEDFEDITIEEVLKGLIAETDLLEVVSVLDLIVADSYNMNIELWKDDSLQYPVPGDK